MLNPNKCLKILKAKDLVYVYFCWQLYGFQESFKNIWVTHCNQGKHCTFKYESQTNLEKGLWWVFFFFPQKNIQWSDFHLAFTEKFPSISTYISEDLRLDILLVKKDKVLWHMWGCWSPLADLSAHFVYYLCSFWSKQKEAYCIVFRRV